MFEAKITWAVWRLDFCKDGIISTIKYNKKFYDYDKMDFEY